jgi:foldase protein PrsA
VIGYRLLVIVGLSVIGCQLLVAEASAQEIFARLNGETIPLEFYQKALKAATVQMEACEKIKVEGRVLEQLKKDIAEQIINFFLIIEGAEQEGITVTDEEIKAKISEMKQRFPASSDFHRALSERSLCLEDLVWDVKVQILGDKMAEYFSKDSVVSDEEMFAFYQKNKEMFIESERRRLSQILLPTAAVAQEIRERLKQGESFSELARRYSRDYGSKGLGGDLGFLSEEDLNAAVGPVAFKLKKLEISQVIKSPSGYHIVKVTDIIKSRRATFAQAKHNLRAFLLKEKGQIRLEKWLRDLRKNCAVELFVSK